LSNGETGSEWSALLLIDWQWNIKSNVFIKPFLHQLISQSAVQKLSLKPQTASNAGVEARGLGKTL
jgi:hypothetical protein